ncbi:MAG: NHL repeat-containing protein [Pirellulales bacterium]
MRNYSPCFGLLFCMTLLSYRCDPSFGDLLVGTAFEGGVLRLDELTGAAVPGGIPPGNAGLSLTSGVTVGPDGNIYVSSRGTGEVLFFDGDSGSPLPSPHLGGRPGLFATLATGATPNSTPGPLRFGPDGHLYVSDFGGNQVRKFDSATGQEMAAAATVFAGPPAGLTFGANGDLYVGDFGSASVLRVSGGVPSMFIPPQSGGLLTPSSLLFLPDGDLLVVDLFGNQILQFDENGQNPSQFAYIPPEIPNPLPPGANFPSNNPSDIAFDSNGNLVLAVLGLTNPPDNRGALLRYDLEGNLLETVLDMQTPLGSTARIDPADFLFGDYDRNGLIEPADYDKWRADFGESMTNWDGADGNGNGIVDAGDYVIWRKAMGSGALMAGGGVAVPEPAATVLVVISIACALGLLRRRE